MHSRHRLDPADLLVIEHLGRAVDHGLVEEQVGDAVGRVGVGVLAPYSITSSPKFSALLTLRCGDHIL